MQKPIGLFDSGIGGLTVLKEVTEVLPKEPFVYLGDTARVPYGGKSRATVTRFSLENARFLESFDVKLLIVACHSASSLAKDALDQKFSFPIIGMVEPGTQKALEVTQSGRIGVIGTHATITSKAYEKALKRLDPRLEVYSAACPLFVSLAEEGWLEGRLVEDIVRAYLEPLRVYKVDTLILGCTHYPMLEKAIQTVMGPEVRLVNPAVETALRAKLLLGERNLLCEDAAGESAAKFFVTDEPQHFKIQGEKFLGRRIPSVLKAPEDYFVPVKSL